MILSARILAHLRPYKPTTRTALRALVLRKAVIRTPKTKDGRVDYDAVPVGGSIWVTVTDPSSPLHGRPILITKRPDRKFALTGGAGWEHYKDGDRQLAAQRGRKHLVLEGVGSKPKAAIDNDTAAKLAEKRKEVVAVSATRRKAREAAASGLLQAAGFDPEQFKGDRGLERWRERTEADAVAAGMRTGDARRLVGLAVAEIQKMRKRAATQKAELEAVASAAAHKRGQDRIEAHVVAMLDSMPGPDQFVESPPMSGVDLAKLADLPPAEAELQIKRQIDSAWEEANQRGDHADSNNQLDRRHDDVPAATAKTNHANDQVPGQPAQVEAATTPQSLDPDDEADGLEDDDPEPDEADDLEDDTVDASAPVDPERESRAARIAAMAGAFADYHEANQALRTATESGSEMRARFLAGAATVENLRQRLEGISDADMEQLISNYSGATHQRSADALYSALRDHWNDELHYSDGIGQYAATGASAALTGLVGAHLGTGIDVGRLVEGSSIEVAAMGLALKLRQDLDDATLDRLIADITRHNATNQQATEDRALDRHQRLERERAEIIRQRAYGELDSSPTEAGVPVLEAMKTGALSPAAMAKHATSIRLEADNLLRQRENLGTALGSMQASAALLEALTRARKGGKNQAVALSFGDNLDAAHEQMAALGLSGKARIRYDVSKGYVVDIPAQRLRRHMGQLQHAGDFAADMEKIKTDASSTDGYEVPGWKTNTGYQWRTEQRNDIEWLRKTGGGVITRVTGAGKTNTALGFAAHHLAANPSYTAAIVVPKGKASEWHSEAQRFSTLPTVPIPDDAKRADVARLLGQHGRGALYIMSHDQAARHADLLDGHDLDGITIDEPHMLSGKGKSKKMSAGAQRIMQLGRDKIRGGGTFNRIALTATPAKSDPVQAFDLVNWVAPGKVGGRERFRRAYSGGFGAGTNAQEEAIQKQVMAHLGAYMSGERLTPPSFTTHRHETTVQRTPAQVNRQKEIERGARQYVDGRVADRLARAANDPGVVARYGRAWRAQLAQEETVKAQQALADMHRENLGGGADNAKISAALAAVQAAPGEKHVFFVDSAAQRQALTEALKGMGYKPNQIANMAAGTTSISGEELANRRQRFKESADVPFVIIDKTSAAGHNLQEGSRLHVLGTPTDAATYMQAQGRIAREPRTGDVHVHTYKYSDSPFESSDWADLDRQLKVLRATAPGLMSGG